MLKFILVAGGACGLIVGTILFITTSLFYGSMTGAQSYGMVIGYASMLIAFSLIFVAVKRYRDVRHGGVIKFLPAFIMGLGISAIASVIHALAWEVTLVSLNLDFAGAYGEAMINAAEAKGMQGEALAAYRDKVNASMEMYRNPAYRMPLTFLEIFPVGLLVSLVSALLLRNSRFLPHRPTV